MFGNAVAADYYMPTLSFKDRGAAVLIAMAKKLGVERVVADSSGNAVTAIAAYSARAGVSCNKTNISSRQQGIDCYR